jgi:hypothetical protein
LRDVAESELSISTKEPEILDSRRDAVLPEDDVQVDQPEDL